MTRLRNALQDVGDRLIEAEATIEALISGQIDAVVDPATNTPVLLSKAQGALRESEERYRTIIETTNEGVWLIDATNHTTFMNRRMAEMLGCRSDTSRSMFEFVDDVGRAALLSALVRTGVDRAEVRFLCADGSEVWTLVEATPKLDADGRYEGALAMVMDISERKRAEAALRASESRFRRLWESGVILLAISELGGRVLEINDAGAALLGYSRGELSSLAWADVTPAKWTDADAVAREQMLATGIASPWEKELICKDGRRVSILAAAAMLDDDTALSIAIDLTGRKRAERDLHERIRVTELTADVALVLAHEGAHDQALTRCAQAFVTHLELAFAGIWTIDAKTSELHMQAMAGASVPVLGDVLTQISSTRKPCRAGAAVGHPLLIDDELVGILALSCTSPLSDTSFNGLAAIANTIAVGIQRSKVMRANAHLEAQLRQAQKMEAVGRLAGGIAHDFNNILSVILTYADFIVTDHKPSDPIRDDANEIHKAAMRATHLTRQLLMFSRQQVLAPRVLDLEDVLAGMENMLRRLLGEDVELVIRRNGNDLHAVYVDEGSIEQVIMNLVVNARDAMPTGGTLTVETENVTFEGSGQVLMSVSDTGGGMDDKTQLQIFEPFFTTKEVGKGTGLGLSTVFGIVQQSKGTIRVRSEIGAGSVFSIWLPQATQAAEVRPQEPGPVARGSETVLLVEDEEQVRLVARAILKRHGYNVLDMRGAGEALLFSETFAHPIDLLLTDVVMPQVSGPELARRLRATRPEMKLLCMSGYTDDHIVRHGVCAAEIAFLQKPFTADTLARKVRDVLDAGANTR